MDRLKDRSTTVLRVIRGALRVKDLEGRGPPSLRRFFVGSIHFAWTCPTCADCGSVEWAKPEPSKHGIPIGRGMHPTSFVGTRPAVGRSTDRFSSKTIGHGGKNKSDGVSRERSDQPSFPRRREGHLHGLDPDAYLALDKCVSVEFRGSREHRRITRWWDRMGEREFDAEWYPSERNELGNGGL